MSIIFLYPSDPLRGHQVDEGYRQEYVAAKNAGLSAHVFDNSSMPTLPDQAHVVYRGWMLDERSYAQLESRFGKKLITSTQDYLNAHYLPNWYKTLEPLTIYSVITDENTIYQAFTKFAGKAFIKDFVKSLKTGKGSIVDGTTDISRALADMKKYRGTIEGGIVLRQVVDLEPNSELRFFVVGTTIFSPAKENARSYSLAQQVVQRLATKQLKFYSIDIATTSAGHEIVIEIGDGQVSDYVGWQMTDFVQVLVYLSQVL